MCIRDSHGVRADARLGTAAAEPRVARLLLACELLRSLLLELLLRAVTCLLYTSCLAAHAAVYHLDGIGRQKFPEKLSGVFDCMRSGAHRILAAAPETWRIPHSRSNDLPAQALTAAGYQILSTSPVAGADMFIRQGKSLFVFLQGHPEYDPDSLLREYHRDVSRFLRREREAYPQMPSGYFDAAAATALVAFRERALLERHIDPVSYTHLLHTLGSLAGAIHTGGRLAGANIWSTFYDIRRYGGLQIGP